MTRSGLRIGIDIGGTFTDCVVTDHAGLRTTAKALTTPSALDDGVFAALDAAAGQIGIVRSELLAATEHFVHGTTQGTNALLTRQGARTGLITTRGHEDSLLVGRIYSKMAGLSERHIVRSARLEKPSPIIPRELTHGVVERIDRDGDVVVPLDEGGARNAIRQLVSAGAEAIAVSLLWSFLRPDHEERVKEFILEEAPFVFASISHEVAPVLGEYERTATTAVNAYIGPVVERYLTRLDRKLQAEGLRPPLLIMQSSGGLTSVDDACRRPIVTLDSGPTGGMLGGQHLSHIQDEPHVVCTDVGGTSFDVGLVVGGEPLLDPAPVVAQYSLRIPKITVRSIGAGGGSIAWRDEGGLLQVGPQSAGSAPGPACYGRGGQHATVTDADLVLGILEPGEFSGGAVTLSPDLARQALAALGHQLDMEPEDVATAVFRIVNAQMADLIRRSTIEQGHDPRKSIVVAYGGAGPAHAAFYGRELGAKAILIPPASGAFSALGMLGSDAIHVAESSHTLASPFSDEDLTGVATRLRSLEAGIRDQFSSENMASDVEIVSSLGMRFAAQVDALDVAVTHGDLKLGPERLHELFQARYAEVYGRGTVPAGGGIELERHRVMGRRRLAASPIQPVSNDRLVLQRAVAQGERPVRMGSGPFVSTLIYDDSLLGPGHHLEGPAVVQRPGAAIAVPEGYEAMLDSYHSWWLRPAPMMAAAPAETAPTLDTIP